MVFSTNRCCVAKLAEYAVKKAAEGSYLVLLVVLVMIDKKSMTSIFLLAVLKTVIDGECQGIAAGALVFKFVQPANLNKDKLLLAGYEE